EIAQLGSRMHAPEATFFYAAPWRIGGHMTVQSVVYPHHSSLYFASQSFALDCVLRPYRGAKTQRRFISQANRLAFIRNSNYRQHRPEYLFVDDAHSSACIINDRRFEEISAEIKTRLSTDDQSPTFANGILHLLFDSQSLRFIDERSDIRFIAE